MSQYSLPAQIQNQVSLIPINLIHPFYDYLFPLFSHDELNELIESIKKGEFLIRIFGNIMEIKTIKIMGRVFYISPHYFYIILKLFVTFNRMILLLFEN